MKICCLSDIHGHLPDVPDCDLLLLGGDYCRDHRDIFWYEHDFREWLGGLSDRMKVVGVAGNHDFYFEKRPDAALSLPWTYLQDSGTEFAGLHIWGSPHQSRFHDWAFNLDEPDLVKKWARIPDDTNILLLHGPPHGFGDFSHYGKTNTGSPGLTRRILEVRPDLAVAGHIHSGYGRYLIGETVFVNASYVDEQYKPANEPVEVLLPDLRKERV
jgi:predicted phosphodiesterase